MKILNVCIGRARQVRFGDRHELTAIGKRAVDGPVAVTPLGLQGTNKPT